jgi:predicted AlkP superfamily pyrophosphatase or phosphodiesterase
VLRERGGGEGAEGIAWGLADTQAEYYRFPEYVNDLPDITSYYDVADAADGTKDGTWRGNDIAELKTGFDTPARIPYQTRALEEVMTREGLGHHDGTDLMFINYKLIDEIGHIFTASSIEMNDTLVAQDTALPGFIDFLDRQVGKGQWVLLITADHGHSADKEVSGGFAIKVDSVEGYMAEQFQGPDGTPLVYRCRPGWSFIDLNELDGTDFTLDDLATDYRGLTKTETSGKSQPVAPSDADDEVLLTSFPGSWLEGMIDIAKPS